MSTKRCAVSGFRGRKEGRWSPPCSLQRRKEAWKRVLPVRARLWPAVLLYNLSEGKPLTRFHLIDTATINEAFVSLHAVCMKLITLLHRRNLSGPKPANLQTVRPDSKGGGVSLKVREAGFKCDFINCWIKTQSITRCQYFCPQRTLHFSFKATRNLTFIKAWRMFD